MQKMAQHMQVEELWFKDGTVVFQAEHKMFCLHSGLVSARSEVFKQILEDKNSDSAFGITRGIYQTGIPLIQLQETAQDANNFFLAIYDIISGFFEPPPMKVSTEVVLSILRMGTKYHVNALRRRALAHLNTMYPLTLDEWDRRNETGTMSVQSEVQASFAHESTFARAFTIAKAAREFALPWVLPTALYECCQYDLEVILAHFARARDQDIIEADADTELHNSILVGAFKHMEATRDVLKFLIAESPADICADPAACHEVRRVCLNNIYGITFGSGDPLGIWDDEDWDTYLDGMCPDCVKLSWEQHKRERLALWRKLPFMYAQATVQNWEVLKEWFDRDMAI
ncbi:hypothetical protein HYPSUDRAFT_684571 [Hypholoma sublateritium FD-334 SS-4]|uniref:BTB domain-containing protein n=1 Tax=Hypholoma sublateritium (strain FD-334 SS-4) TaxID=945553 RepID=A0A0D2NYS0_HYPSF|nr:hypothetical protein HYPSUDRAFT_684571 [Hypholoma sublateritium FD-334 SS-4]